MAVDSNSRIASGVTSAQDANAPLNGFSRDHPSCATYTPFSEDDDVMQALVRDDGVIRPGRLPMIEVAKAITPSG
jgi:hypothetical protein